MQLLQRLEIILSQPTVQYYNVIILGTIFAETVPNIPILKQNRKRILSFDPTFLPLLKGTRLLVSQKALKIEMSCTCMFWHKLTQFLHCRVKYGTFYEIMTLVDLCL